MAGDLVKLSDLIVEVRDKDLKRVGQIVASDLNVKIEPVFNNVGTWELRLPFEHPMTDVLRTPGSGLIVSRQRLGAAGDSGFGMGAFGTGAFGTGSFGYGEGDVLILSSGPVAEPQFESTPEDRGGTVVFKGITDDHLLADRLCYPQPTNANASTQNVSHDVRTGPAETLIHQYVNANIGPSAPASRRVSNLVMGTNYARGPVITRKARFDNLGAFIQEIALAAGLGFRIVQVDDSLVFETFDVKDLTSTVRLDIRNGQLSGQKVTIAPPGATHVVVAGQEEGVNRQFIEVSTADSIAAASEWGRRIEVFKDQRNTDVVADLVQAGVEILAESGFTGVDVQVVPVEDSTMEFGFEWALGDKVGVVVEDQEVQAIATGMVLLANDTGLKVGVVLGTVAGFDRRGTFQKALSKVEARVANLERSAEQPNGLVVANDTGDVAVAGDVTAEGNVEAAGAVVANGRALPFAFAADTAVTPAGGSVAVTFPPGRFTQPPIITLGIVSTAIPPAVYQAYHSVPTTSGFTIYTHSSAALAGVATTIQWQAIQMTSASASG